MFNLGLTELLIVGAAGLLIFGPKRLPELAKALGRSVRDFKKGIEGKSEEEGDGKLPPAGDPPPDTDRKT